MTLQRYREKRHFAHTPEPAGARRHAHRGLRFCVQKHDASHLHYDFRLEMDGVLKSWAVPKGPSLDPAVKRLAIQVEDHPFEYRKFEGIIPEGNYGAGTVMLWDEGTYEPVSTVGQRSADREMLSELEKGHLRFVLHGSKLHGQFSLVKTKGGTGNNWLLFKHADEFSGPADVLAEDRSVASERSLDQIADQNEPPEKSDAKKTKGRAKKTARKPRGFLLSHPIDPMLATAIAEPFDREGWNFEIKWDGFRAIAEIEDGAVKLYSRTHHSFENTFAELLPALAELKHDAVLDGEIVALDSHGKASFELLQKYQKTGAGTLAYYVFDLLYLDGDDLRTRPLSERTERLQPLLKGFANLHVSEHIKDLGIAFFQAATQQGLEGIVAKDAASHYLEGTRGQSWLKIKLRQRQEAVIGGFTRPRGSRQALGALVLGLFQDGKFVYAGHTGGGFTQQGLIEMRARLEPFVQNTCPFAKKPRTNAPVTWVKPVLIAEIAFQEWTSDGRMRQPVFLGLREDKPVESVRREEPQPLPGQAAGRPTSRKAHVPSKKKDPPAAMHASFQPTNLDKVFWPEEGYTKGDLINYYHDMAPLILPYLHDRPMSLNRHPNGIHGQNFFQKDMSAQPPPDWVKTVNVESPSSGKHIVYMVCQNEDTLLYIANLGCIEINPWNSRIKTLNYPDYLVLDLDPQEVPFAQVVETAQHIHKLLDSLDMPSVCKTSGKRGLHIFVPLLPRQSYDEVRAAAETLARAVQAELPETTSVVRSPAQRRGQVYLDYLQNRRGQTMAAPYSVRPIAGAQVSAPLHWREVNNKLSPASFTMKNIRGRVDRVGDLWRPILEKGIDLKKCIAGLA